MKRIVLLGSLVGLFWIIFCLPLNAKDDTPFEINPSARISLDFQDARLKDVLKVFSIQAGLNFIASEAVQDRLITLYLDAVPVKESMDQLFWANNLTYQYDPDSNIILVKDWGKPELETVTKIFPLKYARVSNSSLNQEINKELGSSADTGGGGSSGGILAAVQNVISSQGKIIEEGRTNSFIVTDIPSKMPQIAEIITALDIATPQVMLEVEVLDVTKNTVDKLGFKYGQTPFTAILTGASTGIDFPFSSWQDVSGSPGTGTLAINSGTNTYQVTLDFLRTQTDTKILARPRVLTLNNETAEIKITTQETVGTLNTTSTAGGTTNPVTTIQTERVETGVSLRVTPQVNMDTGEITMFVKPSVKDTTTSTLTGVTAKDPEERTTKSIVRVRDGQTIVLGGLIRHQYSRVITKLPILGDIPIIGALFRHKNIEPDKERELLVFITPHIIKDSEMEFAQAKVTSQPILEREQGSQARRKDSVAQGLDAYEKKRK